MDIDAATDELVELAHRLHDLTGQPNRRAEAQEIAVDIHQRADDIVEWFRRGGFL